MNIRAQKVPVTVNAVRARDVLRCSRHGPWSDLPAWICEAYERGDFVFLVDSVSIRTPEGVMEAQAEDYIIQGVEGELYPCKPVIFAQTYKLLEEDTMANDASDGHRPENTSSAAAQRLKDPDMTGQSVPSLLRTKRAERDPWQNRSKGMRCATCAFYVPKGMGPNPAAPDGDLVPQGRCRRHAPTMSGYPVVTPDDWCGDHKLKAEG